MKKFLVKFEDLTEHPYHFISTKIFTEKELEDLNKKDKTMVLYTDPGTCTYKNYTHEEFDSCLFIKSITDAEIKIIDQFDVLFSNCDALNH